MSNSDEPPYNAWQVDGPGEVTPARQSDPWGKPTHTLSYLVDRDPVPSEPVRDPWMSLSAPSIAPPVQVLPECLDMDLVDEMAAARYYRMAGTTYGRPPNPNTQTVGVLGELALASWLTRQGATTTLIGEPNQSGGSLHRGDISFTLPSDGAHPRRRSIEVKASRPGGWARYGRSVRASQIRGSHAEMWAWAVVRFSSTPLPTANAPLPLRAREWPIKHLELCGWCARTDILSVPGHKSITWPSTAGGSNPSERWLVLTPLREMQALLDT